MYSNTLAPALVPRTTWPNRIERFPMDLGERGGREGGREGGRTRGELGFHAALHYFTSEWSVWPLKMT